MRPKIVYVQYTNPAHYPPLEHSSSILAAAGWEVLLLGVRDLAKDKLALAPHPRRVVRQLPSCRSGWRQKLHFAWFCLWVIIRVLRYRPAWVYASDLLATPAALVLAFLPGLPVVYHEHDSPPAAPTSLFPRLCFVARRLLARRASLCILPNDRRADLFAQEMRGRAQVLCVWNCPTLEEAGPPRPLPSSSDLWLLYHGSIVPPRLPSSVVLALEKLPDSVKLRIVGYETVGHRGYVQHLLALAREHGVGDRIEFIGAVPRRSELLAQARECHVGLALLPLDSTDVNQRNMLGASNKPFDYLACGLALLVADLPDWRRLYVDRGYGLACDPGDPDSIAAAIRRFLEDRQRTHDMGERGRLAILGRWNYETQFAPVLELLGRPPSANAPRWLRDARGC